MEISMNNNSLNNDIEALNQFALEALSRNELYEAQNLFRQNAKRYPCFITFNNLGIFYVFEGLYKPDYSRRRAKKLGISYLKKAELYQKSRLTMLGLGQAYFEIKDYKEASKNFQEAYEYKPDYATTHDLALSFYMQGMYREASMWFKKALSICSRDDYAETCAIYAFSLLQIDKRKCHEVLSDLLKDDTEYMEVEKFTLAYLCNDLEAAVSQIKPMLEHFSIEVEEMAMVFDCLFKLDKKEEAMEYLRNKVEFLEECDYNFQPEIKRLKKVFSQEEYRKEAILSYQYIIPPVKQCCYYGCKQHNN